MSKPLVVDIEGKTVTVSARPLHVLGPVRFDVGAGETLCLLGPSGCGKTTILRLVLGLDTRFDGAIRLGDEPITGPGLDRGMVFQEPRLVPWMSVRRNIAFAVPEGLEPAERDAARQHVRDLIRLVGLSGFESAWPNQLSGGMAQRVAIARALVNVPDLLLMDEPLGSLDNHTRMQMQQELIQIFDREGTTTLMVTHDVDEAVVLSDRIIVLTPKPARVRARFDVTLPRPRLRTSAEFIELRSRILEALYA